MSRFQAQTNAVLDDELEDLRTRLGLDPRQKADLLREVAAIAAWVVRQAKAGRTVEARRGDDVQLFAHPVIDRLRGKGDAVELPRLVLTDTEVGRLARLLGRRFEPTPALRAALQNLTSSKRRPPKVRWKKPAA